MSANILRVEQQRLAAEPTHLKALEVFAERAYRRPLSPEERQALHAFYRESREENGLDHEEAMRDCIVSVLMSPNFCYRVDLVDEWAGAAAAPGSENAGPNSQRVCSASAHAGITRPLSDYAFASRLSYFLWSSMPGRRITRPRRRRRSASARGPRGAGSANVEGRSRPKFCH